MRIRNHTHYEQLKNKWVSRHQSVSSNLWQKHRSSVDWLVKRTKHMAVGSMGGLLLLTTPLPSLPPASSSADNAQFATFDPKVFLVTDLASVLPSEVSPLSSDQEKQVATMLSKHYGIPVAAELEGKRLNRSYGLIGAEQHLARFPGDTMGTHFDGDSELARQHWSSGMAPGLGAWGYFARSADQFTAEDRMREKYYIAVQTFLSPGYNDRVREYSTFFKYRKMLVVNPQNGKALVADIADAGPAEWTGKHLGGSPEVMHYLERVDGKARGPVLYFFVDDPTDSVPLGPVVVQ